jgi:hypothetical protein
MEWGNLVANQNTSYLLEISCFTIGHFQIAGPKRAALSGWGHPAGIVASLA